MITITTYPLQYATQLCQSITNHYTNLESIIGQINIKYANTKIKQIYKTKRGLLNLGGKVQK